ncbi:MAG: hypothetical protein PVJ53_16395, partial [Desulfobacterales bacterium]
VAFLMFKVIDLTIGLRVSPEEELEGLDWTEHGGTAYPDFEVTSYTAGPGFSGGPGSSKPATAVEPIPELSTGK